MAPNDRVVLAYWDIRGLAQPIRCLLEYTGTNWEDKFYICGPAPNFDKSCWFGVKPTLGLDFPNLPYLIDGDVKLTQTKAILKYIARKHGLLGQSEEEQIRIDLVDSQTDDFRSTFSDMCYNPNFENMKTKYLEEDLPLKLEQFSKFLGDNPWFAGQNLSYVDFSIYEGFYQHLLLDPTVLTKYKNLEAFVARFEKLEKVADFIKSPKYIKERINNRRAAFGN